MIVQLTVPQARAVVGAWNGDPACIDGRDSLHVNRAMHGVIVPVADGEKPEAPLIEQPAVLVECSQAEAQALTDAWRSENGPETDEQYTLCQGLAERISAALGE